MAFNTKTIYLGKGIRFASIHDIIHINVHGNMSHPFPFFDFSTHFSDSH